MRVTLVAVGLVAVLAPLSAQQAPPPKAAPAAAKPVAKATGWVVPRTPDGKPDLQGNWTNETQTPLERMTGGGGIPGMQQQQPTQGGGQRPPQR